jgi:versiconal hemiacetal acetate esterase
VKENRDGIKGIAAFVPCTLHYDYVPDIYKDIYKSYDEFNEGSPVIDKQSMATFFRYAGVDPKDSNTFITLATDNHKNFPPVYIASCEKDPLRDDAYVLQSALKKAGVATKHDNYRGLPHYFWIFPSLPESEKFVDNLVSGVKWLISQM